MHIITEGKYLERIVTDAYKAGYMECQHLLAPLTDEIRQSEIQQWLSEMRLDYRLFRKLKRAEVIVPFRKGARKNCALYYYKSEIIRAFDKVLHSKQAPNSFHIFEQQDIVDRLAKEAIRVSDEAEYQREQQRIREEMKVIRQIEEESGVK